MLTCALYCRVSSQEQQRRGTIESQRRNLADLAARLGHRVFAVYEDDGKSAKAGALEAREAWTRLMVDAEARRFSLLLVVDIDRITRTDMMEERGAILGPFQRLGIPIVTPHGTLDLTELSGELIVTIKAIGAAEERKKIMERTAAGRRTALLRGERPHGKDPYGLRFRKGEGWSVEEGKAEVVREIFRRVGAGETCIQVAVSLNERGIAPPRPERFDGVPEWNRQVVWRLVRNGDRRYAGQWLAHKRDGILIPVPAIVSIEDIEAANATLLNNRRRGLEHRTTAVYLLDRGLLRCKRCGSTCGVQTARPDPRSPQYPVFATYVCRRRYGLPKGHPDRCDLPIARVADIDGRLWAELADLIMTPSFVATQMERRRAVLSDGERGREGATRKARAEIERLRKVEAALVDHGIAGRMEPEQMQGRLALVASEIAKHEAVLSQPTERATLAAMSEEQILETLADLRIRVASAGPHERRTITRKMVGRAIFNGRDVRLGIRLPVSSVAWTTEHQAAVPELAFLVRRAA